MFYSRKKYIFYFPLLILLSTKPERQGLLIVFSSMFCIFRFLVCNKNAELVHVSFICFVGFLILFILFTNVLYLQMNT